MLICLAGYDAPNLRKLADKVAAAGFFVVVPDFFYGDLYVPTANGSSNSLPTWLKGHRPFQILTRTLMLGCLKLMFVDLERQTPRLVSCTT
ncbi:putative alpha/Beta hydrolase [Rosa chinensis]|uniref:Putative alpha/Beta hydrolase n=1 Tax=Rosa chinensis TaxID=74649 RepID=A0A2P6QY30_ROSCH|nr:putative alpha/Beta hydrolase [Rosa chinensis]